MNGWRHGLFLIGVEFAFLGVLLALGYGLARSNHGNRFEGPPKTEITYPVATWLLGSALVIGSVGLVIAITAYLLNPTWESGARPTGGWKGLEYTGMLLLGFDVFGAALATFHAAPESPSRVTVLVIGCTVGVVALIGAWVISWSACMAGVTDHEAPDEPPQDRDPTAAAPSA